MKKKIDEYSYSCLNDARNILRDIGMPFSLYNPRCVMVLAACAEMFDGEKWSNASEAYHGTHEIIQFINTHFPNKAGLDKQGYQENSRETIRDETLKKYVNAGIMEARLGLASNDKNNAYRFTAQFAALIRTYNTEKWEDALDAFRTTHESYSEVIKQAKSLEKGYPVQYGSLSFSLGRSPHNKLQKQILDIFVPYFAPGAELLYIGDTNDRKICSNQIALAELGVHVLSDSNKLPDIILFDAVKNRILFIEAFSSTGEFSFDRVQEIISLCRISNEREIAFITAFEKTKKMLSVYPRIAWDTDIWVAEDPTHMTHKNGDKFLGRKIKN